MRGAYGATQPSVSPKQLASAKLRGAREGSPARRDAAHVGWGDRCANVRGVGPSSWPPKGLRLMLSILRRLRPLGVSVRARLGMIQVLLVAALCVISLIAWRALNDEVSSGRVLAMLSRAERFHGNADTMHDALYEDVTAALAVKAEDSEAAGEALTSAHENARVLEENLVALQETDLPADLQRHTGAVGSMSRAYVALANKVVASAVRDHATGLALQDEFKRSLEELTAANDRLTALLGNRVEVAENDSPPRGLGSFHDKRSDPAGSGCAATLDRPARRPVPPLPSDRAACVRATCDV
jgi:hypothetical protein